DLVVDGGTMANAYVVETLPEGRSRGSTVTSCSIPRISGEPQAETRPTSASHPRCSRGATSTTHDDIVVEVHTDEGISGIGETDLNAWVARACIEAPGTHTMDLGLGQTVIGMDP